MEIKIKQLENQIKELREIQRAELKQKQNLILKKDILAILKTNEYKTTNKIWIELKLKHKKIQWRKVKYILDTLTKKNKIKKIKISNMEVYKLRD